VCTIGITKLGVETIDCGPIHETREKEECDVRTGRVYRKSTWDIWIWEKWNSTTSTDDDVLEG